MDWQRRDRRTPQCSPWRHSLHQAHPRRQRLRGCLSRIVSVREVLQEEQTPKKTSCGQKHLAKHRDSATLESATECPLCCGVLLCLEQQNRPPTNAASRHHLVAQWPQSTRYSLFPVRRRGRHILVHSGPSTARWWCLCWQRRFWSGGMVL